MDENYNFRVRLFSFKKNGENISFSGTYLIKIINFICLLLNSVVTIILAIKINKWKNLSSDLNSDIIQYIYQLSYKT
jgi:hypothetical protein